MRGRPRQPSSEELALWRHATRDVDPLRTPVPAAAQPEPSPEPAAPAAKPRGKTVRDSPRAKARQTAPPARQPAQPARPPAVQPPLAPGEVTGVDRRTAERLRQGRLSIDACLDLHGMTQAQAHGALAGFVERCHAQGRRVLLVITGKGTPRLSAPTGDRDEIAGPTTRSTAGVLRARLPAWLAEPSLRGKVLALHPARPQHGGDGAFYVLLKRHRPSSA